MPTRVSTAVPGGASAFGEAGAEGGEGNLKATAAPGGMHVRTRSVMDDLVDHLAALDAVSTSTTNSSTETA